MAGEWRSTSLGALADFMSGGTPSKANPSYWDGDVPWLSAKDMKTFRPLDTEDHVTESGVANGARLVPAGTVFLLTRGMTLLNNVPICVAQKPMAFNQDVKGLRARAGVRSDYLAYVLLSLKPRLLEMVDLAGHGTGRLNTEELKRIDVSAPNDENEQRAIAHILGTLDDKIELNRRMNETLEAIARAIFKSWFVDFDPALAKAATFVEQGALDIGDGYRAKNSELGVTGLPFIRAGDLNDGINADTSDRLLEQSLAAAQKKRSRPGDVVFTSKGTIGRLARVSEYDAEVVYSPQVCFWRSLDSEVIHPAILYCWMRSDVFHRQVAAVAGQTDMAPYVSLRDQRSMLMPVFAEDQFMVGEQISPLLSRIAANRAEAKTLAGVRDALLPKLLSGELRVPLAEAA